MYNIRYQIIIDGKNISIFIILPTLIERRAVARLNIFLCSIKFKFCYQKNREGRKTKNFYDATRNSSFRTKPNNSMNYDRTHKINNDQIDIIFHNLPDSVFSLPGRSCLLVPATQTDFLIIFIFLSLVCLSLGDACLKACA